jgi:hypothetical protein
MKWLESGWYYQPAKPQDPLVDLPKSGCRQIRRTNKQTVFQANRLHLSLGSG